MKKLFGISSFVIMVVLCAWVVSAGEPSHFHKLSLPAQWQGEWAITGVSMSAPMTLEITRADERTLHVIYSWDPTSYQGAGSKEADAEIFTHKGRPAFLGVDRKGAQATFRLEKDGTLTGERHDKKATITMMPQQ